MVDTVKRRKPDFGRNNASPSGRVTHDDRGNAVWQWGRDREEIHGSINHLGLTVDDSPASPGVKTTARAAPPGRNPYDSDRVGHDQRGKKRDLRALSRQIEAQRKREQGGKE